MRKSLWNKVIFLSIAIDCLIIVASSALAAQTQVFTGDFTDSYVDIPFTINVNSEVTFEYDTMCENTDYSVFFLRVAQRAETFDAQYSITSGIDSTSPIENIPLHKGGYIARLTCSGGLSSLSSPEWTMNVISTPLTFAQDQEPDPEAPVDMFSTMSLTGSLGLWGSPGDIHPTAASSQGRDHYDIYYFNMRKGSKLKFKFEWEDFKTSISQPEVNFGVVVNRYRNGQTYFVHIFERVITSGGFTDEVTLLEDGLYQVGFGGAAVGLNDDKKRYGGYKATVILNGESVPGELLVTIQEAAWSKELIKGQTVHVLKIDYEVENTYSVTKTLESFTSVYAPLAKVIPGETRYSPRNELIKTISAKPCQDDEINWEQFCTGKSLNLSDGKCRYYATSTGDPVGGRPISITAHSKKNFTEFFPVSTNHYNSFDDSLQIIKIGLTDESAVQIYDCETSGLSFWPVWSMVPMLQPLLLRK